MSASLLVAPLKIDPAVWRIEIPLVVQQRCETPIQICVWMALRWLRAAHQNRKKGFGIREIATFAKIDPKSVSAATVHLLQMGLITNEGEEHGKNWKHPRPIYGIPLIELERISTHMAPGVLAQWGISPSPASPHAEQAALPLFSDPKTDRESLSDPKTDRTSDPKTDRYMDGCMDVGREGSRAQADSEHQTQTQPESEPPPPIPPPPAPDLPTLSAHPLDLWHLVRPDPPAIDLHQLALFASDHSWYWVGRAILAAATSGKSVRSVKMVKIILDRWRVDQAYGSDTAAYTEKIRNGHQRRTTQPGAAGRVPATDKQPTAIADGAPPGNKPFVFDDAWDAPDGGKHTPV